MLARSKTEAGFTIVETLIFLAISGLMFALAISAMSGKQQTTEFQTGVDTLRSELDQNLSDVSDGNYQTLDNTSCYADPSGGAPVLGQASPTEDSCTIIGEIIAFSDQANSAGQENYTVFPVVGRNYIANTNDSDVAANLTEAVPQISAKYSQAITMPFGLQVNTSMPQSTTIGGSGPSSFGLISFTEFEGSNTNVTSGQALNSGSSHIEVFTIPTSTLDNSPPITQIINNVGSDSGLMNCTDTALAEDICIGDDQQHYSQINEPVTFCVNSGTNNDSALFTIGGINSPSSATYKIYSQAGCSDAS